MSKKYMTDVKPAITVFIPTWFGEAYLKELLTAVTTQKIDKPYEILIYDTSSTDGTQDIIKSFASEHDNIRWKVIQKQDFGHGITRQQAAEDARGDIIVYLSQDAIPAHDRWLYEMVKPFEINEKIVAVMGKQDPRHNAFPLLKYDIQAVFSSFGPDMGTTLFYNDDFVTSQGQYDFISFYSDVNSAARKGVLLANVPYRDVKYAEDQLFGRDVVDAGYIKAFSPRGNVIHSNDMKLREYAARMFDETMGLRKAGIPVSTPSVKLCVRMIVKGALKDGFKIIFDKDYSLERKLYWLVMNLFFHIEKWRGVRKATLVDLNDAHIQLNSLEHRRHKKFESNNSSKP